MVTWVCPSIGPLNENFVQNLVSLSIDRSARSTRSCNSIHSLSFSSTSHATEADDLGSSSLVSLVIPGTTASRLGER